MSFFCIIFIHRTIRPFTHRTSEDNTLFCQQSQIFYKKPATKFKNTVASTRSHPLGCYKREGGTLPLIHQHCPSIPPRCFHSWTFLASTTTCSTRCRWCFAASYAAKLQGNNGNSWGRSSLIHRDHDAGEWLILMHYFGSNSVYPSHIFCQRWQYLLHFKFYIALFILIESHFYASYV